MKKYKGNIASDMSDDIKNEAKRNEKIKTKMNVFFKERLWFEWEIYYWHCSLDKWKVEILKNTPFYKKGKILISK